MPLYLYGVHEHEFSVRRPALDHLLTKCCLEFASESASVNVCNARLPLYRSGLFD